MMEKKLMYSSPNAEADNGPRPKPHFTKRRQILSVSSVKSVVNFVQILIRGLVQREMLKIS